MGADAGPVVRPTRGAALRFWLRLGFVSFGGPAGQIALMHAELVERRRWIDERRFLHALNYCMLLPGPEAQQLATYVGWLLHGTLGGVLAGALFVLPSALILWALSWIYVTCGEVAHVQAALAGLKPAVLAIVAAAVLRLGRRALRTTALVGVAGAAFVSIFFLGVPFPWIVLAAALVGLAGGAVWGARFAGPAGRGAGHGDPGAAPVEDLAVAPVAPSAARALRVGATCLALWWAPILGLGAALGFDHVLVRQGLFFSKAALVTFGGAYAVLPYVAQQAVERHGWVSHAEMLDGLGLAETTPGPLIMVLQFVGFVGGHRFCAPFGPLAGATLGAAITTWATFLPCFLWILVGAPWVERLRHRAGLASALSAITAAVAGVVLNLAVWFGRAVLLPAGAGPSWFGIVIATVTFVGLARWRWNVIPVVLAAAAGGVLWRIALQAAG